MVYVSKLKCVCPLYQPSILGGNQINQGFPGGSVVKNPPAKAGDTGDLGLIPGREYPLGEELATPSSILAWEIPRTEEPGLLQSLRLQ